MFNRNPNESLEEREMLWEHEPQASVSTAFLSSPKLSTSLTIGLLWLRILKVGEFYSMFLLYVHKAGQYEYFSVFSFKIRVIFAEEIQSWYFVISKLFAASDIFNKCWNPVLLIVHFIDPSAQHLKILVLHVADGDLKPWKRPNMFVERRKETWQMLLETKRPMQEIREAFEEVKAAHTDLVAKHEAYTMFLNDEDYTDAEAWMNECTRDFISFSMLVNDYTDNTTEQEEDVSEEENEEEPNKKKT